jgi:hypothetical protein
VNAADIAAALGKPRRDGDGWKCLCPCHEDRDPSLSIVEKDGKLLVKCRADCDQTAVVSKLKSRGLWPNGRDRFDKPKIVATYDYCDENGKLLFQVCRFLPKDFRQRRPDGVSGWIWETKEVRKVPYLLPELVAAAAKRNGHPPRVYITEGEKDADRLRQQWGLLATTNPGGAGKWRRDYNKFFAGFDVVVLPHNDDPGRRHAQDVAANLCSAAASVRVLKLPGLTEKGDDVSGWLDRNSDATQSDFETLVDSAEPFTRHCDFDAKADDLALLSGANWLTRDIPELDFIFDALVSTTSRMEIIGPTGIGKSNFLLALAMAGADGRDFLRWRSRGIPRRILFVDGEMSRRLAKKRIADATRRHGGMPATFFYLNRDDFPDMSPLNTDAGQEFVNQIIATLGGVDLLIFDNIQALLNGDMKDEEPWQQTLPWVRSLTRRNIGQIWVHHTGHDETHGYGTKTREWQLDTVALMERMERPEANIAFRLTFTKARERTPDNRNDFEPTAITLAGDEWKAAAGGGIASKRAPKEDLALEVLIDEINRNGTIPPASPRIPPNTYCTTSKAWRQAYVLRTIAETEEAAEQQFYRASRKLIELRRISKYENWVWPAR